MRKRWLMIPLSLAAALACRADSVTLLTGEKITGTIKDQTDTQVTIEVPVSASITDERVIQKADISKIDKEQPDEILYQSLQTMAPDPQFSYAPETYDEILQSLRSFESKYPNSPHLSDIKEKEEAFAAERQKVSGGSIKFQGQWLNKEEADRRRIQIFGMQVYGSMRQRAAAGDFIGAMQSFDALEKNFNTTSSYPAAVTLAVQMLPGFQRQLAIRAQAVAADQAQLKQTILATPEPARSSLIATANQEMNRNNAVIQAAIRGPSKWVPLIPRSALSISTLQKTAASEYSRLRSVPVAAMEQSLAKVDEARQAISAGDLKTAGADLTQATQLWAQNEAAHYWSDRLKEKIAASSPTPTPKPSASPKPSVARSTPNPALAAQQPPPDKPFFSSPVGMVSTGLVVLVVLAGGLSAILKKKPAEDQ